MKNKSYFVHNRNDLFGLIPKEAKIILDVGCGGGLLGKRLKEDGKKVIGIEIDKEASEEAEKYLDRVICSDVEKTNDFLEEGTFDCIVFGDVLEHLQNPWNVLKEYTKYLKKDGIVLASVPNVRYYKVLIRLISGSWDYVDSGILDRDHLRFFTLINIKEMFSNSGLSINYIGRNIVASRGFKVFNFICLSLLKNFLTYQYYIVAKKEENKRPYKKRKIHKF